MARDRAVRTLGRGSLDEQPLRAPRLLSCVDVDPERPVEVDRLDLVALSDAAPLDRVPAPAAVRERALGHLEQVAVADEHAGVDGVEALEIVAELDDAAAVEAHLRRLGDVAVARLAVDRHREPRWAGDDWGERGHIDDVVGHRDEEAPACRAPAREGRGAVPAREVRVHDELDVEAPLADEALDKLSRMADDDDDAFHAGLPERPHGALEQSHAGDAGQRLTRVVQPRARSGGEDHSDRRVAGGLRHRLASQGDRRS